MTRLFSDMDAAHERMLSDPVAFTDAIAGTVDKAERGAHRCKHQAIAMCVGIACEVREDFVLFEELRNAACLQDNQKVQAATEKNFKKLVPFAVAARSFAGTEATDNRIRVYGYVTGYFVKKHVEISEIASKIQAMKGIDGVYKKLKEKKREAREAMDETDFDASGNTEYQASEVSKREPAALKSTRASGESKSVALEPSEASGERLTVKAILDNHLLIKMQKGELERYLDGSARRGQRRRVEVICRGTDQNERPVWEYVYSRDVEADLPSLKDNDNAVDYEDEDDDAA